MIHPPPPRRRTKRRLALLAAGLAFAYAVLSWLAAGAMITPPRVRPAPFDLPGMACSAVDLRAEDGLRLRATLVEPPGARGTVVVLHGIASCRSPAHPRLLAAHGMRSLALDLRAHGDSEGDRTSYGWFERRDVAAAVAWTRARWPGERIGAWGISLGGAALCYAAGSVSDLLDAVLLESVYATIDEAFASRLRAHLPEWLLPIGTLPRAFVEWRLGVDASELRPVDHAGAFRPRTVFVLTGANDAYASPADAKALADRARAAELWLVPDAGHEDVWPKGGAEYERRVVEFLRSRLGG